AWAAVYDGLGRGAWLAILLGVLALELVGLVVLVVLVGTGAVNWWVLAVAGALLFAQALAFRADWGMGLAILGVLAGLCGGLLLVVTVGNFAGSQVQVSVVMLALVTLLSAEWLSRKMLRLA
ncbi:MAG: hypothetical protein K2V38_23205, partial [Gemmataceae bacterium]|nr:hypothetical protein [Gemmataceae bacterium]